VVPPADRTVGHGGDSATSDKRRFARNLLAIGAGEKGACYHRRQSHDVAPHASRDRAMRFRVAAALAALLVLAPAGRWR
jgi:hypothetical protein